MPEHLPEARNEQAPVPAAFAVLKPLFVSNATVQQTFGLPADRTLPLPQPIVRWLVTGRGDEAVAYAWRRLRIAGIALPKGAAPPRVAGIDGARLLAALMIPLRQGDVRQLGRQLAPRPAEPV